MIKLGELTTVTLVEDHIVYNMEDPSIATSDKYKTNMEKLQERADSLLEHNLGVLHKFSMPVVKDYGDPELSNMCKELALQMLKDDISNASKEEDARMLENRFKIHYRSLMNEFMPQVEAEQERMKDLQERIKLRDAGEEIWIDRPRMSGEGHKIVTLFNVVETVEDYAGRLAVKHHKKLVTTREAFAWMVDKGRIHGTYNKKKNVSYGRIYGYTNLGDLDLSDFPHGDDYVIEHAPGIHEIITEIQFLEQATYHMGQAEIIRYRADQEIRYGRSQELFFDQDDTEDMEYITQTNEFINAYKYEKEIFKIRDERLREFISKDILQYGFRTQEEKDYYYRQLKARFDRHNYQMKLIRKIGARAYFRKLQDEIFKQEFATTGDLVKACAGVLFQGNVTVLDENLKYKRTIKDTWTLPWNAMTQPQRKELLELYHKAKKDITKRNTVLQEVRAEMYEPVIEKINNSIPITREEMKGAVEYAEEEYRLHKRRIFESTVYSSIKTLLNQQ